MTSSDIEKTTRQKLIDSKKEFLVNKNIPESINQMLSVLPLVDSDNEYITKSILALAYMENTDYENASKVFHSINEFYQEGFCELLQGNIDKARDIWTNLKENSIVQWGLALLGFITLEAHLIPSFLQVRNYLECDIAYFIKAGKIKYAENLLAYSDFLATVHPEAFKFIGKALFHNGYPNLAMNYFDKSKELIPNDSEIYYLIAQYMYSREAYYEAKQTLKKCLKLNKSYLPAKWLLESVESQSHFKLF